MAEFPSVTLVNHTCALTGVGPGRHGIVNNAYYDRSVAAQRLTNDARTWHRWAEWLAPGVQHGLRAGRRSDGVRQRACRLGCVVLHLRVDPRCRKLRRCVRAWTRCCRRPRRCSRDPGVRRGAQGLCLVELGRRRRADPDARPVAVAGRGAAAHLVEHVADRHRAPRRRAALARRPCVDAGRGRPARCLPRPPRCASARSARRRSSSPRTTAPKARIPTCLGDWDDPLTEAGVTFRDEANGFLYLGV